MSVAVPSNGVINAACLELASKMANYDRQAIDTALTESKLKQCTYETLIKLHAAYIDVFDDKNWTIHEHIEIKAQQSSVWRGYKNSKGRKIDCLCSDDPLAILNQ